MKKINLERKDVPALDLSKLPEEERRELSLIEVAHYILENKKEVMPFSVLVQEVKDFLDLNENEMKQRIVQFYTDMNIDGNFISLGNNKWGLRAWYPVDTIDEEAQTHTEPEKKRQDIEDEDEAELDSLIEEDVDYIDDEVEELGEEEIALAEDLIEEDEDMEDRLPDGIEGDLAPIEDDYSDGDYTEDPENK